MATSRISNTIKDPSGTGIASVPVQVRLMPSGGFRTSDFTEVARLEQTTTDSTGFWQLDLERNANITPANSWYEVTELVPDSAGGKRVWLIAVGASDQSLLASLVTPAQQQPTVVPAGTVYLDQASADARYQALGSLGSATPAAEVVDGSGTAGVATSASRSDHVHPLATSSATPAALSLTGSGAAGATGAIARSQHVHAYNPPACRVFNSANQSIPNASNTAVTFDSERYDTDSMHSTSSNTSRITFNTAGLYMVTGHIVFVASAVGNRQAGIRLNGSTFIGVQLVPNSGADTPAIVVTTTYKFAVNDYVELMAFQNSGGALSVQLNANYSPEFSATWIGVG